MRELLAELTQVLDQGRACVYCSVIETRGSTPQKAGAAMLVFADGSQRGTLGGGCVEAEVKQRALRVLGGDGGDPQVLTFCLDDNYGWDDGLICGGRMSILADPLCSVEKGGEREGEAPAEPASSVVDGSAGASPSHSSTGCLAARNGRRLQVHEYYHRFKSLVENGGGGTEAVVMVDLGTGVMVGNRYLFDAAGQLTAQLADGEVPELVRRHLAPLQTRPAPAVHQGIAYLPVLPRVTLLIVGGGHVGQAVARLAAEVDFDIWVLDDREHYASRERFPAAGRVLVGEIGALLKQLVQHDISPAKYCLIVTRGHAHDEEALYHLATSAAGYVGMIGSKRKIKLIFEDLLARGVSKEALARVHAPLGFAIGSQTVPEIAVSIVAELIACRNLGATIRAARINVTPG